MNMKQKIITVNADVDSRLAAEEGNTLDGNVNAENQAEVTVQLGNSSYSAVQSAVLILFRQSGAKQSPEVNRGVSLCCKGSKIKGCKL